MCVLTQASQNLQSTSSLGLLLHGRHHHLARRSEAPDILSELVEVLQALRDLVEERHLGENVRVVKPVYQNFYNHFE